MVLASAGHQVVLYDNLANSEATVVERIETITGVEVPFVEGDTRSTYLLESILKSYGIEAVIHFAGLKAVGESVGNPLSYFDNNVGGTISVLKAMSSVGVKRLVFSSSATVYGDPQPSSACRCTTIAPSIGSWFQVRQKSHVEKK